MDLSVEFMAGPLLALICVALVLFGMFTAQIYYYWLTYVQDTRAMRIYVYTVAFLELMHTVFCIHILYFYLIVHFGDIPGGVQRIVWSFPATILCEVIIVAMSQGLYIQRIWHLSKRSVAKTFLPAILLFARASFSITTVSFLYHYPTWDMFHAHRAPPTTVNCAFTFAVSTDITIASILVYYLYLKRTQFARTNHIIQTLMLYTINTGAVTIIFSAGVLATFNLFRNSLLFGGIIEIISKLYANSMLAMLNARHSILQRNTDSDGFNAVELSRPRETRIQIFTETAVTRDEHNNTQVPVNLHDVNDVDYESASKVDTYGP